MADLEVYKNLSPEKGKSHTNFISPEKGKSHTNFIVL